MPTAGCALKCVCCTTGCVATPVGADAITALGADAPPAMHDYCWSSLQVSIYDTWLVNYTPLCRPESTAL
eukprot:4844084-Amphidinium_carterae.1